MAGDRHRRWHDRQHHCGVAEQCRHRRRAATDQHQDHRRGQQFAGAVGSFRRGIDQVFGTGDLGEQVSGMGDLGTFAVGSLTNSIVAAGGNIGTFSSTGLVTNSNISAGLVLRGAAIAAVLGDTSPLGIIGEITAAEINPTLFHGGIKSFTAGNTTTASTMINSNVTAGVSPGADGLFGTADDNVNTSLTGGNSSVTTFKGIRDGRVAPCWPIRPARSATVLTYTTDANTNSSILTVESHHRSDGWLPSTPSAVRWSITPEQAR